MHRSLRGFSRRTLIVSAALCAFTAIAAADFAVAAEGAPKGNATVLVCVQDKVNGEIVYVEKYVSEKGAASIVFISLVRGH